MLKFVYSLPIPRAETAFVLAPAYYKSLLLLPLRANAGPSHSVCVCVCEVCRVLGSTGRAPHAGHPQELLGGLPDGVCNMVSRISLMPIESPGCWYPSFSSCLSCTAHFSILDRLRKKWVSFAGSQTTGEAGCTSQATHLPYRRKCGHRRSLSGPSCVNLGEE